MKSNCGESPTIRPSRVSYWRASVLILINLLMIAHFLQWFLMGKTVSPIEPSESMRTLEKGEINAGFIFFSLALLATLILGRFVCGWGCHILALQDLCAWLMKKCGVHPRPFRSRLLIYIPLIAALYMFVWPTAYRLFSPIFTNEATIAFPGFSNHLVTEDFWATFPSVWVAIPFLLICGFATVYFLGSKGFCTYACPYGGFFGVADKFSPGRIRVTEACNQCGHCTATCTSNVRVHTEVHDYGMVVDPGCMKCMDCVSVCPNDALYFGFGKPQVFSDPIVKKPIAFPSYSLSWPEEILCVLVFAGSFFATRSVYGAVPFLMALGIAAVSSYLALQSLRLFRKTELSFHKFSLKRLGKVQTAGWAFAGFAFLWLGVVVHSGIIRFYEYSAERHLQKVNVPDELVLAGADLSAWVPKEGLQELHQALKDLEFAENWSLLSSAHTESKLGWLYFVESEHAKAAEFFKQAAKLQSGKDKSLTLYYLGNVYSASKQYEQSLAAFDEALSAYDGILLARQEKANVLWKMGRFQDAVKSWENVLAKSPSFPPAHYHLAEALKKLGRPADAAVHAGQAEALTPPDAMIRFLIALKLKDLGMNEAAEKHLRLAKQLGLKNL